MKSTRPVPSLIIALALAVIFGCGPAIAQQTTAFTYQGQLRDGGTNANGVYTMNFKLYDAVSSGNQIGGTVTTSPTLANGLFTVNLDFGAGTFNGSARWLDITVQSGTNIEHLTPRVQVLPTPYAILANSASNLLGTLPAGQLSGTLPIAQLPNSVLTNNASGVTLNGNFIGNGAALTNLNAGSLAPGFGVVPSGGIVLSLTATNSALTAAGFAPPVNLLGTNWTQASDAAPSSYGSKIVVLDGQMWILGRWGLGYDEVWSSSNGVTWTLVTNGVPWSPRFGFGAVALNGQIWVLGGQESSGYLNDVWSSSNGITWTLATNAAPWSPRVPLGAMAFNGRMWVLGGYVTSGSYLSDVWSSSNGVTWTQVTCCAPWGSRSGFGVLALNGQMWVLGGVNGYSGGFLNDVWSSSNGVTWTEATHAAPWSARMTHGAAVLDGRMWVLGGQSTNPNSTGTTVALNDVWSSSNGETWTETTHAAPWSARHEVNAVALNGQMWVLGGDTYETGNYLYDVWFSQNFPTNMLGGFYLFQKQ